MGKVYPQTLMNDVRNDPAKGAEVKLYDLLSQQLGNDWVVFYHVAWLGRSKTTGAPRDGETDFIVAHPKYGILLIEVKGGRIRYDGAQRQWISRDRNDNDHRIAPFEQVVGCKYALLDKLHSLPAWASQYIAIGHAVAFPDVSIARASLPPDAPAEIIIDGRHLSGLAERVEKIMLYWRDQDRVPATSGSTLIRDLERLLAPIMTLPNSLLVQVKDEEQEILRLTAEQFRTLGLLRCMRRAAIYGCAGSGKTTLAVEKARRLASEGFSTLLTCYNKALSNHLAEVAASLKLEQLHVYTFHQLCYHMAKEVGIDVPRPDGTNAQRVFNEDYPDALSRALAVRPDLKFDAIIVDEGQDFQDTWWLALEDCLREGRESIFYVFYDDNQRVYSDRGTIPDDLPRYPLEENVRNTRNIHRALAAYYQSELPSRARGPVGRTIETYAYSTSLELKKTLASLLHTLLVGEQLHHRDLVVLTPKALKFSQLQGMELGGKYRFVEQYSGRPGEILLSTIQSFKGLERPVVIVVELDEDLLASSGQRDALCYVAFSRPRNCLVLVGKKEVILELLPKQRV